MKTVIESIALIALAGGLAVLAAAFSGKLRRGKDFDERQQVIQGRGFMVGFTVMLVFSLSVVLAGAILGRELLDASTALILSMDLGLVSFAEYCIVRDAYVSLRKSPAAEIFAMALLAVTFGVNAVLRLGREMRGGTVFAMQAAVFGIIGVTLLVKTLLGRRNRE